MFEGSMVALVTPMHADGAIAWKAINELVEFHIANGTSAIVSMGTTGESPTLDVHEHMDVVRATIAAAKGRIPVIAGTGANSTSEAVELTRAAQVVNNATFHPFTIFGLVALVYFIVCWPLSVYSRRMERRLAVARR